MGGSFIQHYATIVSEQLDYLPSWPLTYDVRLGDVGVLDGKLFRRTDTLEALGLGDFGARNGNGNGNEVLEITTDVQSGLGFEAGIDPATNDTGAMVKVDLKLEGSVFLRVGSYSVCQM